MCGTRQLLPEQLAAADPMRVLRRGLAPVVFPGIVASAPDPRQLEAQAAMARMARGQLARREYRR